MHHKERKGADMKLHGIFNLLGVFCVGSFTICLLAQSVDPIIDADQNKISKAPPEIVIYSLPNFKGNSLRISKNTLDLPLEELEDGTIFDWNDNVGSVRVIGGTWRLYQQGRFNRELDDTPEERVDINTTRSVSGWSNIISATSKGPLEIKVMEEAGMDRDVSSIRLISENILPDWVNQY